MKIQTHPTQQVLYVSYQTTFKDMIKFVGQAVKQFYAEVVRLDLLIGGPQYWIYYGADGNPDTIFTLEIALPVQGNLSHSTLPHKELPSFKSITLLHEGQWTAMGTSYGKLVDHLVQHHLMPTGVCREAYLRIDMDNPENNLTEIQMGIA